LRRRWRAHAHTTNQTVSPQSAIYDSRDGEWKYAYESVTLLVLLRAALDLGNRVVLWTKQGQRVHPGPRPVRVNLGSALVVAPGWIHVDASPNVLLAVRGRTLQAVAYRLIGSQTQLDYGEYRRRLNQHRFVYHDLTYGIPFPDSSVDFLYSSHFLEHLELPVAVHVLNESHRVLRPGGVIRVCVPDLRAAVQFYLTGQRDRFLAYFFTDRRLSRHRHRYMYDFELLRHVLAQAGFVDVVQREFQMGRTPDLVELDNRADETLYVEAAHP